MRERAFPPAYPSAECALARRQEYRDMHDVCRQTRDVPLPHHKGLFLTRRCPCRCHRAVAGGER